MIAQQKCSAAVLASLSAHRKIMEIWWGIKLFFSSGHEQA